MHFDIVLFATGTLTALVNKALPLIYGNEVIQIKCVNINLN
jgi:hypothetical protein